jgi:hypothetical protein
MAHVDAERRRPMLERPSFAWDRLLHPIEIQLEHTSSDLL